MNELTVFNNDQFGEIRTVTIDGAIWFVARDVALALGYAKPQNAIAANVEEDDALKQGITDALGRTQETTIINESGLYSLIMSSKLPTAKAFKRWVTSEILPSIRKTGGYQQRALTPNEMFMLQAQINVENEKRITELESRLAESDRRLAETVEVFRSQSMSQKDVWQTEMNKTVNELVDKYRLNHQTFRRKLYTRLEMQLGIDLNRRKTNLQKRMRAGGCTYREMHDISMLRVVAEDAKLRSAFELIVKQEAAAYAMSGRAAQ